VNAGLEADLELYAFDSAEGAIEFANIFGDWIKEYQQQLSALKELNLSSCQLTSALKELGSLRSLQKLDLSHNQLTAILKELESASNIGRLTL